MAIMRSMNSEMRKPWKNMICGKMKYVEMVRQIVESEARNDEEA